MAEPADLAAVAGDPVSRPGAGSQEPLRQGARVSWDLEHLDQVGVEDRPELRDWQKRKSHTSRKILYYGALALIPVVILLLMILMAHQPLSFSGAAAEPEIFTESLCAKL